MTADHRQGDDQEQSEGGNLDDHQHGIERGAFLGSNDQQGSHERNDNDRGQVDQSSDFAALEEAPLDRRADLQGVRQVDPDRIEQSADKAGPADRDGRCAEGIFEDQGPAHQPGDELTHHRVGVSVSGAGDWHHRGELGIAERGKGADHAGDHEADHHARAGLLRGRGGQHENAGADDGANAEQGQLEGPEGALERLLLGGCKDLVERLDPPPSALSRCDGSHVSPLTKQALARP